MKKRLLLILSIVSFSVFGQDIIIQNGTLNVCSGTFYDSGGAFGSYADNENFVFTLCPDGSGDRMRLDFTEFSTQPNVDTMAIYDGDSTTSDLLGVFSAVTSPGLIAATFDNPTGCLTIEFISDDSGNTSGWAATVSCTTPCQDITSQLDSTVPAVNAEGIIEVCTGDNISLNGSGVFEVDGAGATYEWDLGDGNSAFGESVVVSYDIPGVYLVDLHITDTNTDNFAGGCPDSNALNLIIRVSGEPDFTGTQADDDTLCFGESTVIQGVVTPLAIVYNCPPPESEETFLPDGSGAAYSTCINVTCFEPDAVLTDVSEIVDICLNMEHSYSGDLDIKITSPNGQEVRLFDQAGGGTYFGGANDDGTNDPGVGADYCFSMSASVLLADANTIIAGSNDPSESWEPGSYLPVESFDALLGSPLNGEWCIEIVDNLAIDNGYIFSWELNFDSDLTLEDYSFVPTIVSQSWDPDASITEVNGNAITVSPDGSGEYCYTYRVVDIFGCEYTEEVCVVVADESQSSTTYYEDVDGDGYGDPNSSIDECTSQAPMGYVANNLDCNDGDPFINPDADDSQGNNIDENCDGIDGIALSIDDVALNSVSILPNPFVDFVVVDLPSNLMGRNLNIDVYDLNGRTVYNKTYVNVNREIVISNLDTLPKSAYFIKITDKKQGFNITKKLIKF